MTPLPALRTLTPGLALVLALFVSSASPVHAQPMSSGSGAGTGTGMSGGATRNSTGTGQESGTGLRLPGANNDDPFPPGRLPRLRPGQSVPLGPGANVTFPDDIPTIPIDALRAAETGGGADFSRVSETQLRYARLIPAPGDRSLALSRIANAAMFGHQLDFADSALADSASAALKMQPGMIQDQRLISIITALIRLVEDRLRDGTADAALPTLGVLDSLPPASGTPPAAIPPDTSSSKVDRIGLITKAREDARTAANLALRITNPTYRSQEMNQVAESLAIGSQKIVTEFPRDEASRMDRAGLASAYQGLPDQMLQLAAEIATRIDRPVWHDEALVAVSTAAAESKQFSRALTIARLIPLPEVRSNALLKIAETQARRGDPKGATATYQEAANAVAAIPQDDPRAVLAGVLVDNLISLGRFEDARSAVVLYPDESRRRTALGAVAEAMGFRGAARSALDWINRDAPPQYRSWLYRRVNNGVVHAIEEKPNKDGPSR